MGNNFVKSSPMKIPNQIHIFISFEDNRRQFKLNQGKIQELCTQVIMKYIVKLQ